MSESVVTNGSAVSGGEDTRDNENVVTRAANTRNNGSATSGSGDTRNNDSATSRAERDNGNAVTRAANTRNNGSAVSTAGGTRDNENAVTRAGDTRNNNNAVTYAANTRNNDNVVSGAGDTRNNQNTTSTAHIEKYYNKFNEDHRLTTRHGIVEFTVTMQAIEDCAEELRLARGVARHNQNVVSTPDITLHNNNPTSLAEGALTRHSNNVVSTPGVTLHSNNVVSSAEGALHNDNASSPAEGALTRHNQNVVTSDEITRNNDSTTSDAGVTLHNNNPPSLAEGALTLHNQNVTSAGALTRHNQNVVSAPGVTRHNQNITSAGALTRHNNNPPSLAEGALTRHNQNVVSAPGVALHNQNVVSTPDITLHNQNPSPLPLKIADIGAGTGRYSIALAQKGYDVTAVELVKRNLEVLRSKHQNVKTWQGDARNLHFLPNNTFDITLLFGPLYHLHGTEEKLKAIKEAMRITKKGGKILIAYVMNEYSVISYCFKTHHWQEVAQKNGITADFHTISAPDELYDYVRLSDINELNQLAGLKRQKIIAPDGPADYMRRELNEMSDSEFQAFIDFQKANCARPELLGASSHIVDICTF